MSNSNVESYNQSDRLKKILLSNGFVCSFLTIILLFSSLFHLAPLQSLENSFYDRLNTLRKKNLIKQVVLIEIDEKSIEEIGAWPWPRSYVADMTKRLSDYGAAAIGIDILYSEKEINPGITEIEAIRKSFRDGRGRLKKKSYSSVDKQLISASRRLDNDGKLAAVIRQSGKVGLPLYFSLGGYNKSDKNKLPSWLLQNSLAAPQKHPSYIASLKNLRNPVEAFGDQFITAPGAINGPLENLANTAKTVGHTSFFLGNDTTIRKHPLFVKYNNRLIPSLPLQLAFIATKTGLKYTQLATGEHGFTGIINGNLKISTDKQYRMLVDFGDHSQSVMRFSFADVARDKVPAQKIKNSTVIIGVTASDLFNRTNTPINSKFSPAMVTAFCTSNILNMNYIKRPAWTWLLNAGILIYFMLFLLFIIPRVNMKLGSLILGIFLTTWIIAASILLIGPGYWFNVFGPIILSICGFVTIHLNRKFSPADKVDENSETNKMLGLSFQGQGMLDMAFDKFMKCSLKDPSVKDLLYNLGLDFERKRMHNKAVAVYEYILRAGKFKDIKERISKLKTADKKVVVGTHQQKRSDATLIIDTVETKPTLGRYEVLKEIGQGAIGTVYLGRDPKINREVAIKVLRYEEVSEDQLSEVKKRFYREAEAAGRLNHPNIVTIYDAGEDYDLTYMAMELLNGKDLSSICKEETELPVPKILEIIGAVAEALEYAHKNGVVHRDIKPANIMILEDGQTKVADFGIARIIDSSKTHTGDILGTPNYMSPEQVAGKKVDGRSDLFSLGAVFYELLTGEKPFQSDTMAAIMYNIANGNYTPVSKISPDAPKCCIEIVDKLLTKGVTKRFQSASTVVAKIKECQNQIAG